MATRVTGTQLLELLQKLIEDSYGKDFAVGEDVAEGWGEYPLLGICFGPREGCVNESSPFWNSEDVGQSIIDMFHAYYNAIRSQIETDYPTPLEKGYIRIVIQPDYQDDSFIVMYTYHKHKVVLDSECSAWGFNWSTPAELAEAMLGDYKTIAKHFRNKK